MYINPKFMGSSRDAKKEAARARSAERHVAEKKDRHRKRARGPRNESSRLLYGMTMADYDRMHAEQDGRCAICGTLEADLDTKLYVDHCHTSGRVRGLLCRACNSGLGQFRDQTEALLNAVAYLHKKPPKMFYHRYIRDW